MWTADDDGYVLDALDGLGGAPGLLYLRGVGRNAHGVRLKPMYGIGHGFSFHVSVKQEHLIAAPFGHGGQVRQAQVGCGTGVNGQAELGVN
jgi:hypothetical protein